MNDFPNRYVYELEKKVNDLERNEFDRVMRETAAWKDEVAFAIQMFLVLCVFAAAFFALAFVKIPK